MDSSRYFRQRIALSLTTLLLAIVVSGCTSTPAAVSAAPHSTVPRGTALHLAKQVAASIDGKVFAIAPSGSMVPTLDEGSIVTIEHVSWGKLKKGDIVVYRNSTGSVVIHRLYEKYESGWFVLGDHNTSIDRDTVSSANLLGRVCAIFYTAGNDRPVSQENTSAVVAVAVASAP